MYKLNYFSIKKLHGYKNYNIKFNDNKLVLIGENGTGKTTILRILYCVLSGQWNSIAKFEFKSISLKVNSQLFTFSRKEILDSNNLVQEKILRRFPPRIRKEVLDISTRYIKDEIDIFELEKHCDAYNIPTHIILRDIERSNNEIKELSNNKFYEKARKLKQIFGRCKVLYLPTYRRIEQELDTILTKSYDTDSRYRKRYFKERKENLNYIELIEFGMKDVDESINETLDKLKEFARKNLNSLTLGYLGDVVDQKYKDLDIDKIKNTSDDEIDNILKRIDPNILSEVSKKQLSKIINSVKSGEKISEVNVHIQVICHYFTKLLNFQEELDKKEFKIKQFCKVCSEYMLDKSFNYTSSTFDFEILSNSNTTESRAIKLDKLSSGEKQIVSLFSHLYLSDTNEYFVLIDEPELSLSVPWQRKFLVDIIKGGFCSGLFAVTHSPFIYDNELENSTYGLGEFLEV